MTALPDRVRCRSCHHVCDVIAPEGTPQLMPRPKGATVPKGYGGRIPWHYALSCPECDAVHSLTRHGLSETRRRLVEQWRPLAVRKAVKSARRRSFGQSEARTDDHISTACDALIAAAMCFDAQTGWQFATYAGTAIDWRLTQYRGGEYDQEYQISEVDGVDWDDAKPLEKIVLDPRPPADAALEQAETAEATRRQVERLLATLPEQDALVIRLRTLDGKTLADIGKQIKRSKEMVRQIQNRAMKELRREAKE